MRDIAESESIVQRKQPTRPRLSHDSGRNGLLMRVSFVVKLGEDARVQSRSCTKCVVWVVSALQTRSRSLVKREGE